MKTALTILVVFFVIGVVAAIGTIFLGGSFFSASLPRGEGGLMIFSDGAFSSVASSGGLDVLTMEFSDVHPDVVYAGTRSHGAWVSADNGQIFKKALDDVLGGAVTVYDIAENTAGDLYIALYRNSRGSVVRASPEAGAIEVYFSTVARYGVFGVAVRGTRDVSFVSSDGGFYRSTNGGASWGVRSRIDEGLLKLKSRVNAHWALTSESKIFYSADVGQTWTDRTPRMAGKRVNVLDFSLDERTGALLAVGEGVWRTADGGASWEKLNLIVPADSPQILSAVVHPQHSQEIFAVSSRVLYRTIDGGETWSFVPIPEGKPATRLFVDESSPDRVFIAINP